MVVGVDFRGPAYLFCVQFSKDPSAFLKSHQMICSEHHGLNSPGSRPCEIGVYNRAYWKLFSRWTPAGGGTEAGWTQGNIELWCCHNKGFSQYHKELWSWRGPLFPWLLFFRFVFGLFHLTKGSQGSSILYVSKFHTFLRLNNIPLCVYATFLKKVLFKYT